MATVFEVIAGLVLIGVLVTLLAILAAFELGRLVARDDEQREVETSAGDRERFRPAA